MLNGIAFILTPNNTVNFQYAIEFMILQIWQTIFIESRLNRHFVNLVAQHYSVDGVEVHLATPLTPALSPTQVEGKGSKSSALWHNLGKAKGVFSLIYRLEYTYR
jgi:hypothetical protein